MIRLPPGSTRTHSLLPYTTLCRSGQPCGCPGSLGALQLLRGGAGRRELLGRDAYVAPSLLDPSLPDRGHRLQMLGVACHGVRTVSSEEHTPELQSIMRISYAAFCMINTTFRNRFSS